MHEGIVAPKGAIAGASAPERPQVCLNLESSQTRLPESGPVLYCANASNLTRVKSQREKRRHEATGMDEEKWNGCVGDADGAVLAQILNSGGQVGLRI